MSINTDPLLMNLALVLIGITLHSSCLIRAGEYGLWFLNNQALVPRVTEFLTRNLYEPVCSHSAVVGLASLCSNARPLLARLVPSLIQVHRSLPALIPDDRMSLLSTAVAGLGQIPPHQATSLLSELAQLCSDRINAVMAAPFSIDALCAEISVLGAVFSYASRDALSSEHPALPAFQSCIPLLVSIMQQHLSNDSLVTVTLTKKKSLDARHANAAVDLSHCQ